MIWADRLKDIMKKQDVTQIHLAEKIGMTQQHLSRMLQGDVKFSTLEKIAAALDIPVTDLVTNEAKQEPQEKDTYDEEYRRAHVHGYIRIGDRIVEVNSMQELKDAVTACEVNYLK